MSEWILGLFLVAHGIAHVWSISLSQGWASINEANWAARSWILSGLLSDQVVRTLSTLAYSLSLIGFVAAGGLILLGYAWGKMLIVPTAILSALTIIVFWDGRLTMLTEKGVIGLVINIALIVYVVFLSG
jgi:hypothetical protein